MGTLFVTLDQEQTCVSTAAFEYPPSQDGPSHRKLHTDLERGLRGLLEEVECGVHPEEGGHGIHPCYDHRGGRWKLDYDHQDNRQEHLSSDLGLEKSSKRLQLTGESV